MNRLLCVARLGCHQQVQSQVQRNSVRSFYLTSSTFKDEGEGSDKNADKKEKAKQKLSSILQDLQVSGALDSSSDVDSKRAKPKFSKPVKRDNVGKLKSEVPSAKEVKSDLVEATRDVASNFDKPVKAESELLQRLKQVAKDTDQAKRDNEVSGEDLGSLFGKMRVERSLSKSKKKTTDVLKDAAERQELSMEQMAFLQKRAKLRRADLASKQMETSVDLGSGSALGIFSGPMTSSSDEALLGTWRACEKRELGLLSTPPPRNALEEMILQTKQGKLWHFPVNNEQGKLIFYLYLFKEKKLKMK